MDLLIQIDRSAPTPLVEQIERGVRMAIEAGQVEPGARLPSTREFALQLGVTRFTVDDAYSRLVGEGYLEGRHGSGTYVAEHVRMAPETVPRARATGPATRSLSQWAQRLASLPVPPEPDRGLEFTFLTGTPALDKLPLIVWQRLIAREARNQEATGFSYGETAGMGSLREVIAAYAARSRGVSCTADQVVVTSGVQQSMDLLMRLVIDPGSTVLVEDPGYEDVRATATLAGATVRPVPVDGDGLRVDLLPAPSRSIRLVCITPSHQYPTGAILPLARRLELLRWAQATGALIMEDDYDSELRYDSRPVPALAALAMAGNGPNNVVYLGSFSKVLFPALRLGYAILPPDLVPPFVHAKRAVERQAPALTQAAVATFIAEGHFERHLARMRRVYSSRHDALLAALDRHLPGIAHRDASMRSAGLHVLTRFDVGMTEDELVCLAANHGIGLEGAGRCYTNPPSQPHLVMGYSSMPEDRIDEGIKCLAHVIRRS